MLRILFICHGNICRSPMAEFVFRYLVEQAGLASSFEIASAATSTEEIWRGKGNPVYPPAARELRKHGIGNTPYTDFSHKEARQLSQRDYSYYDYLLCADHMNVRNSLRLLGGDPEGKLRLLMDFSHRPGEDIADPWYSGDFSATWRDVLESCQGLLAFLRKERLLKLFHHSF